MLGPEYASPSPVWSVLLKGGMDVKQSDACRTFRAMSEDEECLG